MVSAEGHHSEAHGNSLTSHTEGTRNLDALNGLFLLPDVENLLNLTCALIAKFLFISFLLACGFSLLLI